MRSDGIWGCFGVSKSFFDQLGSKALTIGNVILTKEYDWQSLGDDTITHELKHADQWAIAGLAGGLIGQAGFAGTYGGAQALFGTCGNPFEIWAGIGPDAGVREVSCPNN